MDNYMYESFEEYCEIMRIGEDHPNRKAFEIIWNMARLPAYEDEEQ